MGSSADTVLRVLARRWIFLIIAAVVGGLIGIGISATRPTQFASSAFLLGHATGAHPADSSLVASSAKVYAKAATDPGVIGAEFRDNKVPVDPNRVDQYVSAIASPDTPLLEIKATTDNAAQSVLLANSVANAVAAYSHSLSSGTGYEMQAFRTATAPSGAVGPGAFLFGLAGALLALLGVVIVVVVLGEVREEAAVPTQAPAPAPAAVPLAAVAPVAAPPVAASPVAVPPPPVWPTPVASIPRLSPRTDPRLADPDDRSAEAAAPHPPWQFERAPDNGDDEARRAPGASIPKRESAAPREAMPKVERSRKVERGAKRESAPEPRPSAEG
jgi:capsular polysaccharide biosynthesis protein